jgi:PAS domain S-box-containing protein
MEKARILIVEDEAIIAMELEGQLRSLGYEVTSIVDTGEKAIKKAEEDKPDLILMDIRIKGEIDGIDTAEIIRNQFGIHVIFSTAYLDQERIERAKITMPFGYVLKPIQERDLRVTIEMALYVSKVDIKREKTEELVKKNEEKFRLLYERAPISYQSLDENGCFIIVNDAWLNTFGYTRDEVIGKSFSDFIHPEWTEHFKENFPRFKRLGEVIGVEFEMQKKDGSLILVSIDGKIGVNEDGSFKQTHCIIKNITDVREAEQKVKESEQKFKQLVDNSLVGVYIVADSTMRYCNHRFAEMWGYENPEEAIGLDIQNFVDKTSISQVVNELSLRITSENQTSHYEAKCVKKNGEVFDVEVLGSSTVFKGQKAAQGMVVDITERKLAEEALKESEANLKAVLDNAPDHVMMLDLDHNIKYINRTQYSAVEDIVGKSVYDQLPENSKNIVKKNIELVLKKGSKQRYEIEFQTPNGQIRIFESHLGPVKTVDKITGLVLLSRDITDR